MKTIGNILWFVLAGIWLAFGYAVTGVVFCITIIGIPLGIQLFKMAQFSLWPFGRHVERVRGSSHVINTVGNVIWLILFGWAMFLAHIVAGTLLCITIVGIPFGVQAFKLSVLALWPMGREVVEG
jgi:uncharacterized membrane protein YccF (DUF307 family)